jgi:selenocysteine lyase/cysteine desulfurase
MLDCQRHLFSIPRDVHYVNCAYMSPLLKSVEAAGIEGVRRKSRPWEIAGDDFFAPAEEVRAMAGRLVQAPLESVALTPAVSYGAAIVAGAIPLSRGQNVVLVGEEFPSVVYVWRERCRQTGAELRTVPRPEPGPAPGRRWNERLLEAIDRNTAALAITAVHWTDGTRFDLPALRRRTREVGAALIVDGTQSVGAQPFDFAALQPDALLCAGYKWLLGPYSLGFTVLGERLRDAEPLEHNWIARQDSENFAALVNYRDEFQPGARRFDVGERSNFALIPMLAEGLRQLLEWGPASIEDYCARLKAPLAKRLENSLYRMSDPSEQAAHLFGVPVPDAALLPRIQAELNRRNVHVSLRGSAIRLSPNVYNDAPDMETLAEALLAAAI